MCITPLKPCFCDQGFCAGRIGLLLLARRSFAEVLEHDPGYCAAWLNDRGGKLAILALPLEVSYYLTYKLFGCLNEWTLACGQTLLPSCNTA